MMKEYRTHSHHPVTWWCQWCTLSHPPQCSQVSSPTLVAHHPIPSVPLAVDSAHPVCSFSGGIGGVHPDIWQLPQALLVASSPPSLVSIAHHGLLAETVVHSLYSTSFHLNGNTHLSPLVVMQPLLKGKTHFSLLTVRQPLMVPEVVVEYPSSGQEPSTGQLWNAMATPFSSTLVAHL